MTSSKAAPPTREQGHEDAGTAAAATGRGLQTVAETSSEFGGALGIAVLGSIMAAVYRHELSATGQVGETIGEALGRGGDLGAAGDAFVQGHACRRKCQRTTHRGRHRRGARAAAA